jgi:hypothetical protein
MKIVKEKILRFGGLYVGDFVVGYFGVVRLVDLVMGYFVIVNGNFDVVLLEVEYL